MGRDAEETFLAKEEAKLFREFMPSRRDDGYASRKKAKVASEKALWTCWFELLRREWSPVNMEEVLKLESFKELMRPAPNKRRGAGARHQ